MQARCRAHFTWWRWTIGLFQNRDSIVLGAGPLGKNALAARQFTEGDTLATLSGNVVRCATRFSFQIDEGSHLDPTVQRWKSINHACEPNLQVK